VIPAAGQREKAQSSRLELVSGICLVFIGLRPLFPMLS